MFRRSSRLAILLALCVPLSACAAEKPASAPQTPSSCQPGPCVTLNAQELNILGPIVGGRFQQLQQDYQALGAVIQDIQKQTAPAQAKDAPKK